MPPTQPSSSLASHAPSAQRADSTDAWTPIEHERAAIARELHDELGSLLAAARFDLVWVESQSVAPEVMARVRSAAEAVQQAQAATRRMALDLRPPELEETGLSQALQALATAFERRHGIAVELSLDLAPEAAQPVGGSPSAPPAPLAPLASPGSPGSPSAIAPDLALAAYRIAQEGLANIARHAACRAVRLSASTGGGHLTLELRDDGRGFDPASTLEAAAAGLAVTSGTGLRGLRERAALLGGWLDIASRPGAGTTLVLCLPLERRP